MTSAWRPRSMATLATLAVTGTFLMGCTGIPDGTEPVTDFELERYLGEWYEIARLDHSFEEGLDCVTATYSRRDDGGVKVINRGYDLEERAWDEAEGRAYFIDDESVGRLKVSFFGRFTAATTFSNSTMTTSGRWWQALTGTTYGFWPARQPLKATWSSAFVSAPPS